MMRMCYSMDFSTVGRLKRDKLNREGGNMRAILRHNHRTSRIIQAETSEIDSASQNINVFSDDNNIVHSTEWVHKARRNWKENIDKNRICNDQFWFNPKYYNCASDGWISYNDLPDELTFEPDKVVMSALHDILGIEEDKKDGVLRYGEGKGNCGGRRLNENASDNAKKRRKLRKAVRSDAVLAVDVILQGSPAFFFPKIRAEAWTQDRIDKSMFEERGELDQGAVEAFRNAGLAWAKEWWGENRIAEIAFHLDESCPHMHIIIIPEVDGKLRGGSVVAGPENARKMLDAMEPFFKDIHIGLSLERPELGGQSTGQTYSKRNQQLREEIKTNEEKKFELANDIKKLDIEKNELVNKINDYKIEIKNYVDKKKSFVNEIQDLENKFTIERSRYNKLTRQIRSMSLMGNAVLEAQKSLSKLKNSVDARGVELKQKTIGLNKERLELENKKKILESVIKEFKCCLDAKNELEEIQSVGDDIEKRYNKVMSLHPNRKPREVFVHVAKSYKIEMIEERNRADEIEDILEDISTCIDQFIDIYNEPKYIISGFFDFILDYLNNKTPEWLQEMNQFLEKLRDEARRREEEDAIKFATEQEGQVLASQAEEDQGISPK